MPHLVEGEHSHPLAGQRRASPQGWQPSAPHLPMASAMTSKSETSLEQTSEEEEHPPNPHGEDL